MMYTRYSGSFLSKSGVEYRVDILQESDIAFNVGELRFEAEEALVIEWERVDKEEVVCGSTATLKIESPGDRTYQDLYTITPGNIRMDVYRNKKIYWSGALDPEFYEEPYERASLYAVTLTFSDFGILDRKKYDLTGMQNLKNIVLHALEASGINYTSLDTSLISTTFSDASSIDGGASISVRSENFIDEDGEYATLREVIEGILQPLALRMVQRAGIVYLYDINGLYNAASTTAIYWTGDSQTLGTDKVANNVKVTFSPYSSSSIASDEMEYGGEYDVNHYNLSTNVPSSAGGYGEYYSYMPDYNSVGDSSLIDFTIFLGSSAKGSIASLGNGCKYFHILPMLGSVSETSGVAYAFRLGHADIKSGNTTWKLHSSIPRPDDTTAVLTTSRVFLPAIASTYRGQYKLRLVQEMLLDCRYNPFGEDGLGNEKGNDERLQECTRFVFIHAQVTLYDENGNALYHYRNRSNAGYAASRGYLGACWGTWVSGADPGADCLLEYYDPDDIKGGCGIRGWAANHHAMGRPDGYGVNEAGTGRRPEYDLYESFKKLADGEYIPYPPCAGYIEVKIMAGVDGFSYNNKYDMADTVTASYNRWTEEGIYEKFRWLLYKAPKLEVVNNNLVFDEAELEDVEYSGYINKAAKEELSIDTICGTSKVCPTAKGAYYIASTGEQLSELRRANRSDSPEKLFIGTLYSQYADRRTTLSGEASIDGGLSCYTEANQDSNRFMLMSDMQDLIEDCTQSEYCEIRPDEYESIEEVD